MDYKNNIAHNIYTHLNSNYSKLQQYETTRNRTIILTCHNTL